ncbi:Fic family protein [Paenibacillus phyllosphaerae]|uniref:Fic family protein n=1 Tax=Paenibacillus phyllosphaerae TaxID=274593 RepID=A0A7W5FLD8_9BACL|nr:Fic family protein [Paenibacillus phyllosphaerae]MBB3109105.1 Fic family protein [Paenibacillus phyllosphaerae]
MRKADLIELPLRAKNNEPIRIVIPEYFSDLLLKIEENYRLITTEPQEDYLIKEALSTSVIEGAKVPMVNTNKLAVGELPQNKSEQMVWNSLSVLRLFQDVNIISNGFTEVSLIELWENLILNACDNLELMGLKYRVGAVSIIDSNQRVTFTAPDHRQIQTMMNDFFTFMQSQDELPVLIKAIVIHYYFVYIHPFPDGNGRLGRMLLSQYLISAGYTKFATISITTEVLKNLKDYYASLEQSENDLNDVSFFINYYLQTLLSVLKKASQGLGAGARFPEIINKLSNHQAKIVRNLHKDKGKFITSEKYAEINRVTLEESEFDLAELVVLNVLRFNEEEGLKVYKWWEYEF